jgi:putative peptide zinc metalloprotease protein
MQQPRQLTDNKLLLRQDLQITLVKDGAEKIYTVVDPTNDRYFQFKEYEYIISQLFDGNRTGPEIIQYFEEHHDAVLPAETLETFARKLFSMGLIEGAPIPPKKDKYSGLLFKKFKLINPDPLFNKIIPYVGFLFHPISIKIFAVIILIAGYLLVKRWDEVAIYGMPHMGSSGWMSGLIVALIIVLIISSHEFAHGLSLKYYGGKVPEMGFMLLLFLPAFYCDVSDAWKLPKKRKLFVTFAGGYYEILVGAVGVIVWTFAEPHLWLANLAYLIMISSIFTLGFNFNPLIRLDGYYLLSDFLEMPNLRSESVEYVMRLFKGKSDKLPPRKYTTREKIIYFLYGILSTLFIIFMLSLIFTLVAGWLVENLRLQGVLISIFILIFLLFSLLKGIIKSNMPANASEEQKVG